MDKIEELSNLDNLRETEKTKNYLIKKATIVGNS
jgi:hypothetical protein